MCFSRKHLRSYGKVNWPTYPKQPWTQQRKQLPHCQIDGWPRKMTFVTEAQSDTSVHYVPWRKWTITAGNTLYPFEAGGAVLTVPWHRCSCLRVSGRGSTGHRWGTWWCQWPRRFLYWKTFSPLNSSLGYLLLPSSSLAADIQCSMVHHFFNVTY